MQTLPMFPLGGVALPGERLPLRIFEPRYRQLLDDCLDSPDAPVFGSVLIERGSEVGGGDTRGDIGARLRITGHRPLAHGQYLVECITESRIRVARWREDDPYPRADVEDWPDGPGPPRMDFSRIAEDIAELFAAIERLAAVQEAEAPPPPDFDNLPVVPGDCLYALATQVPMSQADRRAILAAPGPPERAEALRSAIIDVRGVVDFQLTDAG